MRTLFATAEQPHSGHIFIKQKILPLDKLINQQELVFILAYKVINGTYLLNDFLNYLDVRHQIQLRNNGDLRIPLYTTTLCSLPSHQYLKLLTMQVTYAAYHQSVLSRLIYDSCIHGGMITGGLIRKRVLSMTSLRGTAHNKLK